MRLYICRQCSHHGQTFTRYGQVNCANCGSEWVGIRWVSHNHYTPEKRK